MRDTVLGDTPASRATCARVTASIMGAPESQAGCLLGEEKIEMLEAYSGLKALSTDFHGLILIAGRPNVRP
ncbi:hypothetical protein GCM10008960_37290 [Deinococcus sedimenti]|uniref:Uncharacterized protein n=1 Tax=Deinococcus sedimenti TaxID=1867090 RepID=A0ABQ2SB23_9DEIO|nr:hypothetical protein GCM10008960_37290 [Deinococcus sedimenti]